MPDLEERVSGMETRLTQIETEIPHLKESLDRNTKSNEKMTDVLNSLEKTMLNINYTTQSQEKEIQENKNDIKDVKTKVEMLEEDITFIYEYKDQKMVIYGKYKVFGDKLLCELDMDDPLDGYYSMETYLFTYTINEEGIEHSNPYARTWFKDFEYYVTKIMLKKIQN